MGLIPKKRNKMTNKKATALGLILGFISGGGLTVVVDNLIKVSDEVQEWMQSKPVKTKPSSEGGLDYEPKYADKDFQFEDNDAKRSKNN